MLLVDNFCQVVITAPQHADEYLEILMAVKGSSKEKRLASQFIARFFKHFPTYADQAIEAQLDLCEDEDIAIRKQAIKDLPSLCKDSKDHTHKISDILAQLLQAEDSTELAAVHNSLMTLLKIDAKGTLSGLFSQIINGDDLIRERCIKFVTSKIKSLGHEDVNAEEFYQLLELLSWTRLGQTVAGQQELVDMIAEQADLNQDFEPQSADNENVDRLLHCFKLALPYFSVSTILACFKLALPYFSVSTILVCFKLALPYFSVSTILACFKLALPYFSVSTILACFKLALPYLSVSTILACFKLALPYFSVSTILTWFKLALPYLSSQVNSTRFVSYVCEQVLPRLGEVKVQEEGSNPQLELLKLFAELCTHCGALDNADAKLDKIFNKLLDYMPLPPDTDPENPNQSEPRLEFSHVECLMYAYHRLGKQSPDTLTKDQDRLKDFKLRLQYFARGIQGYIKKLREALHGKTAEELKTEENKIKVIALKTTSNINTLIKDLFHSPPSFKSVISLSWKPTTGAAKDGGTTSTGQKRHTPITFSSDSPSSKHYKTEKSQREIYQPPSGKYSTKVSSYTPYQQQSRGGRARGRGGFRGTSRGFRGGRNWRRNY
uniref:Apoptosis inhibitor 5 n=1 Tax=Timema tahoe TaxID=61484 RepID=A0A7R9ID80_9NEOP|nr:unnamed protein product [Timema tahoe]